MHVFLVAEELGISRVVIPLYPGHLSALGQILSDQRHDFVRSWGGTLSKLSLSELASQLEEMRNEGQALLSADRFDTANVAFQYSADVRYAGQSFTLSVPVSMPFEGWELLQEQFAERHIETYGYADKLSEIEIVALRCVAFGLVEKPTIQFRNTTEKKIVGNTDAWFNGAVHSTPIYSRRALPIGSEIEGPAIIEEAGGTTVIPIGWRITVDPIGNLDGHLVQPRSKRVAQPSALRHGVDEPAAELLHPQGKAQRVDDGPGGTRSGGTSHSSLMPMRVDLRQASRVQRQPADERLRQVAAHAVGEMVTLARMSTPGSNGTSARRAADRRDRRCARRRPVAVVSTSTAGKPVKTSMPSASTSPPSHFTKRFSEMM